MSSINLKDFQIGGDKLTIMAGPCAIESREMCFDVADKLKNICDTLDINYIFKASFDKANRSSINSKRGVGIEKGLEILQDVKNEIDVPVVTDVHESSQCAKAAEVVDILQIPAFLSRQTDLIVAAAKTGKIVNVKKGQFMSPWETQNIITKVKESGNDKVMICERGSSFGYNALIVDYTGMCEMQKYGCPIVFDATHSVQKPGGGGTITSGNREYVYPLSKAAIAIGINTLFMEVHPNPDKAISDAANQVPLMDAEKMFRNLKDIYEVCKNK